MRLFIAINFNDETRARLLALRDKLRSRSKRGNFSLPENLHLTLAFLGECDAKQTASVKNVMTAVNFAPFDVMINQVGLFKRGGTDIWWAGAAASEPLINLQRDLTNRLTDAGFTLDKRRYSPHITLGREVETDTTPWAIEPFGETVTGIDLMKSERINGKLTYTAIYKRS
jgi:2'-5' RNA ligase